VLKAGTDHPVKDLPAWKNAVRWAKFEAANFDRHATEDQQGVTFRTILAKTRHLLNQQKIVSQGSLQPRKGDSATYAKAIFGSGGPA
jgi:hypothetical protein